MNIFNRFFLWLLLGPSFLYRKMGVNIPHLRAILTAKLMMDDRRVSGIQQSRRKKQKPPKFATVSTMFFTALMGCVFLYSFAVGHDYLTELTIYFSFYVFILASTLISDFTSVLIDVRDNMIILPKPISDKTFVLARLLHIVIHVSKLILPMALPASIYLCVKEGLAGLFPFIFLIIAATLFTIFLINALYIFILKITTPEKFKNIISYFQIFFAIFFYAGYQLVPRLVSKTVLSHYSITSFKWAWITPPYWFAAGWQYLRVFNLASPLFIYFILSVAVPLLSVWLVIKYFAPSFNRKLSMIGGSEIGSAPVKTGSKGLLSTTSAFISSIAKWFTEKGAERMSFLNTWKLMSRSRDFKMKVYPSIGYILVYVVIIFMNNKMSMASIMDQTGAGRFVFLGVIYFSSFVLVMAVQQLMFSEKYKAAWIYYITPIQLPGKLFSGALKAAIVKFYLPLVMLTSIVAVAVVGPKIIPNLLLGIFNQFLITTLRAYISMRALPFSVQQATSVKGGGFIRGLFSMLITIILAILHFMIYGYLTVIIIFCVLSAIASWLMMDSLKNKTWATVMMREYED